MRKHKRSKVIDVTGIELMPGEPETCLGNGERGFSCCCDECEFFLICYPEYFSEEYENTIENIELVEKNKN